MQSYVSRLPTLFSLRVVVGRGIGSPLRLFLQVRLALAHSVFWTSQFIDLAQALCGYNKVNKLSRTPMAARGPGAGALQKHRCSRQRSH